MSEPPFIHYDDNLPAGGFRFLHVEKISTRVRRYNWELVAHRHRDLYQVVLIDSGAGQVSFDLRSKTFSGKTLIVVPPLVVHSFSYSVRSFGRILTISEDYVRELSSFLGNEASVLDSLSNSLVLLLNDDFRDDFDLLSQSFDAIQDNLQSKRRRAGAVLSASMLSIFGVIREHALEVAAPSLETQRRRMLYNNFRTLLEEHFREQLSIAEYANMMSIAERTLHRACKDVTGSSPLKIAHRRVVLEAQRLLLYSSLSIGEIAYHLGFSDPSSFSRFFVDQMDEPPQTFRRMRLG